LKFVLLEAYPKALWIGQRNSNLDMDNENKLLHKQGKSQNYRGLSKSWLPMKEKFGHYHLKWPNFALITIICQDSTSSNFYLPFEVVV